MATRLTYKAAGVDTALKQRLVPVLRRLAAPTLGRNVLAGVGGFGALVGLDRRRRWRSPVLVAGADGVGTKLMIAFATDRHDTVGIDCVAMCANDIVCHGAEPLFFLDYIAAGKLRPAVVEAIVRGLATGCKAAGMSLVGGETAQMPGLYRPGHYDLAGFAVGVVERQRVPLYSRLRCGDVLIGLASNGLHSNGYALARRVLLGRARLKLSARVDELGCTLADELLRPTTIYVGTALALFRHFGLKALAHITGGGLPENLPRILPHHLDAHVRRGGWPVAPIFRMIARLGSLSQAEMERTFNNGIGMVGAVPFDKVDAILRHLRRARQPAWVLGELRSGSAKLIWR
jgi:phosphoribosylformylglycinamidine cyclo-ligase